MFRIGATNIGYPGYVNAGISEIFGAWIIPTMFGKAASGDMSPEDALAEADKRLRPYLRNGESRE